MDVYFSDFFDVSPATIEKYGAFNISLVADLPLFIDPFLLFNSKKPEYRSLHDHISDFTTNLILEFLLVYTQSFAQKHIDPKRRETFSVRSRFNYETETWERRTFDLPALHGDYVLLTPNNMLTKDDTWINKADL